MNNSIIPQVIENFRNELINGYSSIKNSYELYVAEANSRKNEFVVPFEDFFHDWAQALWELLVERVICATDETLCIYGDGSDYEAKGHSRVFFHALTPTHEITCTPKNEATDQLSGDVVELSHFNFEGFVSRKDTWFSLEPSFDHVLFTEKEAKDNYRQVVVSIEQINFSVSKIEI